MYARKVNCSARVLEASLQHPFFDVLIPPIGNVYWQRWD